MNYNKIYYSIISNSKGRSLVGYTEEHHIVPKCLGGDDSAENLAKLTAREHFLVHLLLVKMYPSSIKVKFAFNMMLKSNKSQDRITSKLYDRYKKINSEALSELHKGKPKSEAHRKKISQSNTGKIHSAEHRLKISTSKKGKPNPSAKGKKPHPNFIRKKGCSGYYKGTPESAARQGQTLKNKNKPSFNTKGYKILTPAGFQDFDGVAYSGLIPVVEISLIDGKKVITSTHHRFDHSNKRADDYKSGEFLNCEGGLVEITSVVNIGKKPTYDILNVANGNLYYGNGVQHHNCEIVTEESNAIVPEFKKELQDKIIKVWEDPAHYTAYVSMDIGFKDLTGVLFAYYDFKNAKLIIKDELVLSGTKMLTDNLALEIKMKESSSFINKWTGAMIQPHLRVADNNNPILLQDLAVKHGIAFMPTAKDNFEAALNNMRMLLKSEKIIIDPKCKHLIAHLKGGVWNNQRSSFARSPDKGHYDLIHSIVYMCRNINFNLNPYPSNGYNPNNFYSEGSNQPNTPFEKYIQNAFTPKFKRRRS